MAVLIKVSTANLGLYVALPVPRVCSLFVAFCLFVWSLLQVKPVKQNIVIEVNYVLLDVAQIAVPPASLFKTEQATILRTSSLNMVNDVCIDLSSYMTANGRVVVDRVILSHL